MSYVCVAFLSHVHPLIKYESGEQKKQLLDYYEALPLSVPEKYSCSASFHVKVKDGEERFIIIVLQCDARITAFSSGVSSSLFEYHPRPLERKTKFPWVRSSYMMHSMSN